MPSVQLSKRVKITSKMILMGHVLLMSLQHAIPITIMIVKPPEMNNISGFSRENRARFSSNKNTAMNPVVMVNWSIKIA